MTKRERIIEIMRRLEAASPFTDGIAARAALEQVMRSIEDEFSGVPENPDAASSPTDGRMYPPDDRFEIFSGCAQVREFKMVRHRTCIGDNGSLRITRADGSIEINLSGTDGKTVADLLAQTSYEPN